MVLSLAAYTLYIYIRKFDSRTLSRETLSRWTGHIISLSLYIYICIHNGTFFSCLYIIYIYIYESSTRGLLVGKLLVGGLGVFCP